MAQSPGSEEQANFLGGCLVEGDSEFEKRARKIKRRALVASIILQVLIVAALVLVPPTDHLRPRTRSTIPVDRRN